MCTYNGAPYLWEQLSSIAEQSRLPDELIVCDDQSSDGTIEILKTFAAGAPFAVRIHVNETNLGVIKNFEKSINLCAGDIIALADQDDVWHPEKLALLENEFSSAPDVGLVFTDAEIVDENLNTVGPQLWGFTFSSKDQRLFGASKCLQILLEYNVVTGATMAFRAKFKPLIIPIPTNSDYNFIHDRWIAMVIASVADISFVPKPLIKYRQHPTQQLGVIQKKISTGVGHQKSGPSLEELVEFYLDTRDVIAELYKRLLQAKGDYDLRGSISVVESRIKRLERQAAHMRSRAQVRALKKRHERVLLILRELVTLRYQQHSKGVRSALKDFVYNSLPQHS